LIDAISEEVLMRQDPYPRPLSGLVGVVHFSDELLTIPLAQCCNGLLAILKGFGRCRQGSHPPKRSDLKNLSQLSPGPLVVTGHPFTGSILMADGFGGAILALDLPLDHDGILTA
jgi:hypothetical protein